MITNNIKQVLRLKKLKKSLDGVVVHSKTDNCEICINSEFKIQSIDFNYFGGVEYEDLKIDIENCINKGIKKMQEIVQNETKKIFK